MKKKICFAASSGGHLEELACLKDLVKEDDFVFTEKSTYNFIDWCSNIYTVKQINRKEILFFFKFVYIFLVSLWVILKEKPSVIISTGALATFPICLVGKLLGKKIVYIESFARVDCPSLTGKLVYKFADLFIVQCEELLKYYPSAKYGGIIF